MFPNTEVLHIRIYGCRKNVSIPGRFFENLFKSRKERYEERWLKRAGNLKGLNINDFIGQLHGCNNIQHICGFTDLLVFEEVKVG